VLENYRVNTSCFCTGWFILSLSLAVSEGTVRFLFVTRCVERCRFNSPNLKPIRIVCFLLLCQAYSAKPFYQLTNRNCWRFFTQYLMRRPSSSSCFPSLRRGVTLSADQLLVPNRFWTFYTPKLVVIRDVTPCRLAEIEPHLRVISVCIIALMMQVFIIGQSLPDNKAIQAVGHLYTRRRENPKFHSIRYLH
jgi:hypothetical protein